MTSHFNVGCVHRRNCEHQLGAGNYGDGANPIPVNLQQPTNQERTLVNARLTWNTAMDDGVTSTLLSGSQHYRRRVPNLWFNYGPALGYSVTSGVTQQLTVSTFDSTYKLSA